ncbi:hypothetical protein [Tardiphaga alba]|uniref:hypothetical protein n=1 Tax=Tardiphaga alba TaxID=340268 RepID=UPI001BA92D1C|nr:hypothetical protein [Tardiphaga alba]
MSILFVFAVLAAGGWMLVKRYERHLDAQIGPWILEETKPERRRVRRRHNRR